MNDKISKISKKVGDYFAKKFKDADNELFAEISETAIDGFIEEIEKDNPVLASWVSEWRNKNLKNSKIKKKQEPTRDWGGCYSSTVGGC